MPADCSSAGRYSTRKASMTMSWVADAVATISAAKATSQGALAGSWEPSSRIAAISRICATTSQPRRWPSTRPSTGTSKASTSGAQRKEADGAKRDAALLGPGRQRRAGERERQARREAEHEDDEYAPVEEHAC